MALQKHYRNKEEQSFDIRFSIHIMGILPIAGIVFLLFCNISINKQQWVRWHEKTPV